MKIDRLMVIPQKDCLDEYVKLSRKYGCGFEYNDFFVPALLEDEEELDKRIELYKRAENRPVFSTVHGAFLDVTVFSDDPRIKEVAEFRVKQSLEIAVRLGAEAVIFHTNYIPTFHLESYKDSWVKRNVEFWSRQLEAYPTLNIYIENMFDTDWELLARLGEQIKSYPNFGICLDYAHAHAFGNEKEIDTWVRTLAPYVKHLHINDNDFVSDLHLALGEGRIDWKQFKRHYNEYFAETSVLLEITGLEKTQQSLKYLSQI